MPRALSILLLLATVSTPAAADIINFTTPDAAAVADGDCSGSGSLGWGPLGLYRELGVQVTSNELFANRFLCDPSQSIDPFGRWHPIIDDGPFGPLTYWWMDGGASLDVVSLNGQPILGIDLTVTEKNSRVDWCSEIISSSQGTISLCDGFSGHVAFADYGFVDGLTSFHLGWGRSGAPYFWDPYITLSAIEVSDPVSSSSALDVPEPNALALAGMSALVMLVLRRRSALAEA